MDIVGARELARRLGAAGAARPPEARPKPLASKSAPPIFHWFGIEQPRVEPAHSERPHGSPAVARASE